MKIAFQIQFLLIIALILGVGAGVSFADDPQHPKTEILQQYRLTVTGLDCKKCIPDVRKSLEKVPGVRDAKITHFNKAGSDTVVEVISGKVSGDQLVSALKESGFKAEVVSVGEPRSVLLTRKSGFSLFEALN